MKIIIGIDIGTSSVKAVAYDTVGNRILESKQGHYKTLFKGLFHEQSPDQLFSVFMSTVSGLIKKIKNPGEIACMVLSSALHSLILVDKEGTPLTNCIIWSDRRSEKTAEEIKGTKVQKQIYFHSGTPIHPMSPLCKIKYFHDQHSQLFKKTEKFISIKEYIIFKLYGQYLIDYSLASATGLFDIIKLKWYAPALKLACIHVNQLSKPVKPTFQIKNMAEPYAKKLSIGTMVPMVIGSGDGPLANLGSLVMAKKLKGSLTLGTSGAVRISISKPLKDQNQHIFNYIIDEGLFVAGGAVNNGGIILSWINKLFQNKSEKRDPEAIIFKTASKVVAGSNGLVFIPWIMGERAPIWDANAKGQYRGVSFDHEKKHFIRASFEGICFNLKYILNTLEALSTPLKELNVNGGLCQSDFICQMLADITNKKITRLPNVDLSVYGAIILGLKAMGKIDNYSKVPTLKSKPSYFFPHKPSVKVYNQNYAIFKSIVDQEIKS